MLQKYSEVRALAYTQIEQLIVQQQKLKPTSQVTTNLNVYKQVMDRERKHWEHELHQKTQALEDALIRAKRLDTDNFTLKSRISDFESEIMERDACEAKVQDYVKQLLEEKARM